LWPDTIDVLHLHPSPLDIYFANLSAQFVQKNIFVLNLGMNEQQKFEEFVLEAILSQCE